MATAKQMYYNKRGPILAKNLKSRYFDAWYCETAQEALQKALELIPEGSTVGWGGAMSAEEIGLMDALDNGKFTLLDRAKCATIQERDALYLKHFSADVYLCGANGLSMDGEMVNIDGTGNRLAAINYGPKTVLVIAGMNKVEDTLEDAVNRARTVAAPLNQQRFLRKTPCTATATCADCKSAECICNQILITRMCRPAGRIKFILVGEDLGL